MIIFSFIKKEKKSNQKRRERQKKDQVKFTIKWICKFNKFNDFCYVRWFE